jgi:hypothetical protein
MPINRHNDVEANGEDILLYIAIRPFCSKPLLLIPQTLNRISQRSLYRLVTYSESSNEQRGGNGSEEYACSQGYTVLKILQPVTHQ